MKAKIEMTFIWRMHRKSGDFNIENKAQSFHRNKSTLSLMSEFFTIYTYTLYIRMDFNLRSFEIRSSLVEDKNLIFFSTSASFFHIYKCKKIHFVAYVRFRKLEKKIGNPVSRYFSLVRGRMIRREKSMRMTIDYLIRVCRKINDVWPPVTLRKEIISLVWVTQTLFTPQLKDFFFASFSPPLMKGKKKI